MGFHAKLDFRTLRKSRSKREMKANQDSPTLPTTPGVELPSPLVAALENANNSPRHRRPTITSSMRGDLVSGFFNLEPPPPAMETARLEHTVKKLFSEDHFHHILTDQYLFLRFSAFVNKFQPQYVPTLIRYMEMLKAAKAIEYANAITKRTVWTDRSESHRLSQLVAATMDTRLQESTAQDLWSLCNHVLPAFVTHTLVGTVADCVTRDITGNPVPALAELVGGLAEVFCLTDPSLKDNPIIYASEEFYHTTQYGMSSAINRNCRFLQGPDTDRNCVARLSQAIKEGRESSETILNYRRDGSPFVNLLMMAPLMDDVGKVKYFIGCQVDVTGLVEQGRGIESFRSLLDHSGESPQDNFSRNFSRTNQSLVADPPISTPLKALQDLSQMFSSDEIDVVRRNVRGSETSHGSMVDSKFSEDLSPTSTGQSSQPRRPARRIIGAELSDHDTSSAHIASQLMSTGLGSPSLPFSNVPALPGVYKHYLLVRPYPSLQIVFTSPSLRVPGLLRCNFLHKVSGPEHTASSLEAAFKDGAPSTAKVLWHPKSNSNSEGRPRWVRCSPLVGSDGRIGVWMIIIVPIETQNQELLDLPYETATQTAADRSASRHSRHSRRSAPASVRSRSQDDFHRQYEPSPIRTASIVNLRKRVDGQGIAVRVPLGNGSVSGSQTQSPIYDGERDMYADYRKHSEHSEHRPIHDTVRQPRSPSMLIGGENRNSRKTSIASQSQRL